MTMSNRYLITLLGGLLAVAVVSAADQELGPLVPAHPDPAPAPTNSPASTPTPKKPTDHRALIHQYRNAVADPATRHKIVEQIRGMGEKACADLQTVMEQELSFKLRNYQKTYAAACAAVAITKVRAAGSELITLREKFNEGAASPTHESITADLDPILAKLTEMLQPSAKEIQAKNPQLPKLIEELKAKSADWQSLTGRTFESLIEPLESAAQMEALVQDRTSEEAVEFNLTLADKLDPQELAGIRELNRIRLLVGRRALPIDMRLTDAARGHSHDMKEKGFFSHESPVEGKKTPWDRAATAGTNAGAENIAAGQHTGVDVIGAWWHSPGHFVNMMGDYRRVGLGRADTLWTQMFGR